MIGARALSAVFCLLVAAGSGLQPSPGFAQSTSVAAQAMQWPPADETLTLFLRMDPVDADVLFHKDPYDTSSFAVSIEEDGRLLSGRIEIAAALVRDLPRKSLLLNLAAGDSWHGLRQVSLNAMGTDSTMLREYLTWSLFRVLGMAVPRVQYARVTINNEYIGLFLFVEAVAPEMFDRRGLGGDGALFRPRAGGYCGDLTVASLDRAGDCWEKLSPAGTDAWELAALIREIEATPVASFAAFVDRRFDVDSLLNWLAATILTSDNETYNKGYFLYRSRREPARWTVAPWGHDRAYGRVWDPVRAFPADLYNDNFRYSDPPDLGAANPLKDKLFANPELFRRLKLRLGHLLGVGAPEPGAPAAAYGWFSPPRVNERL
ncbi:MAG: CotH kinase family protein, partial [Desulfobulbaceae bacterium]|nr:CotH kinase family protein [Desulfobulbaceae bacterium]